jgi:DNA polymerase-3 subunit alpha
VGAQAVEAVVEARGGRDFASLADFASRLNPRTINKRVLESLAAAGAFDALEANRARVFAAVDRLLSSAQRLHDANAVGQSELFAGPSQAALDLPAVEPWLPADRLQREFDAVGFFLSGHPLDDYAPALKRLRLQSWAEFARAVRAGASAGRVAGTVVARLERRTRTGSKMGVIQLSDPSGQFEAIVFAEGLQQFRDMLEPGNAVLLSLSAEAQGDDVRARIQNAELLDQAAAKLQKGLRVFLRSEAPIESVAKRLEGAAPARPGQSNGHGEVSVVLMLDQATEVEVKLPGRFPVSPQIAGAIKAVPGVVAVEAL